jgi:hypothetical protein
MLDGVWFGKTTLLSIATGHQGPIPFPVQRTINYHSIFPYNWPSTILLLVKCSYQSTNLSQRQSNFLGGDFLVILIP